MGVMKAIEGGDEGIYVDRCRYTLISHPLHGPLRGILILPTVTEFQLFSITLVAHGSLQPPFEQHIIAKHNGGT